MKCTIVEIDSTKIPLEELEMGQVGVTDCSNGTKEIFLSIDSGVVNLRTLLYITQTDIKSDLRVRLLPKGTKITLEAE